MLLWPVMYVCIGTLVFVIPPLTGTHLSKSALLGRTVVTTSILYPLYRWPTWNRNALFYGEGRKMFMWANYDISKVGFFAQELVALVITMLLACLWQQWIEFARTHCCPV
jgi:hypothetical protein